jgi:hypothetical protein
MVAGFPNLRRASASEPPSSVDRMVLRRLLECSQQSVGKLPWASNSSPGLHRPDFFQTSRIFETIDISLKLGRAEQRIRLGGRAKRGALAGALLCVAGVESPTSSHKCQKRLRCWECVDSPERDLLDVLTMGRFYPGWDGCPSST